jgi:hypothetical protein
VVVPLRVLCGRMLFMGEDAEAEITGDEELPQGPFGSISFANLDETDFEKFCYDLLFQLGFVNIDGSTPPSVDSGLAVLRSGESAT